MADMTARIDLAAAAGRLLPEETADWAADQRVFISSVMDGLADERRAVARAVAELGAEPVWFEEFGGRDDEPTAAYLSEVRSCSVYVGILGRTYGRLLRSRLSATHEEYREAESQGLRISAWVKAGEDWQGDQRSFVQEVRLFHTTGQFAGDEDLAHGVRSRLRKLAAEDLSPWVKLGDVIFRAQRIESDGTHVTVSASVHDPGIVATLEAMRPGLF